MNNTSFAKGAQDPKQKIGVDSSSPSIFFWFLLMIVKEADVPMVIS